MQLSLLDEHEGASSAVAAYTTGETSSRTIRPAAYDERSWAPRSPEPSARLGRRDRSVLSSPSDAMQDPFGDREEPQAVILAPAFTQEESVPMDELPAPVPPPAGARPPRPPKASAEDCQRIYNDRNCCDDEQLCEDARERLRRSPITSVSLDISPRFNPTLRSASDLPERERTFEEIERTWRDRSGQVVARGAMTGVRHGRVIIQTVDGRREEIALRRLSDDDICFFNAWWGTPNVCLLGDDTYAGRHFTPLTLTWKASALCHKPLYFEEVQLERYGHTTGPLVQPFLSGAHFFVNIAALPYRAGINPPSECMYALGYYRPGSCAPWLVPPVPLSVRGALAETAVVLGGVMLIP